MFSVFRDGDGILDFLDNCPSYANGDQSDIDGNGEGTRNLGITVKILKFRTLFSFCSQMLVIRAGSHKMFFRIANREDPDQTASSEAV